MRSIFFVLLFIFLKATCCFANATAILINKDSLQKRVSILPHDTARLKVMEKLVLINQGTFDYLKSIQTMFKEAQSQKNDIYICKSAFFEAVYYYNNNQADSVYKWAYYLMPIAERLQNWHLLFSTQNILINTYTYNGKYEFAINEAMKMQEKAEALKNIKGEAEAYQCLINAYDETNRKIEEKKVLLKAYRLFPKLTYEDKINILNQYTEYCRSVNDNQGLKKYLDENTNLVKRMLKEQPDMNEAYSDVLLYLEVCYIYYYTNIAKIDSAQLHINKAKTYITPQSYAPYLGMYQDARAKYYSYQKKYSTALTYADSALNIVQKYDDNKMDYAKQLISKANIYQEMGEYSKALPIYKRAHELQDSITEAISAMQLKEIKSMNHFDRLIWEEGKIKNRIQIIVLLTIIIALILCISYMRRIKRIRKALKISEQETLLATQQSKEANETKTRFLSNISHAIRVPLNSVVGFCQILATETDIDETTRIEYSDIIQQNTEKLMRLVNNVLALSRLEANMMKYQLSDYDIIQLCKDAIAIAQMQNPNLHIKFQSNMGQRVIQMDCSWMLKLIVSTLTSPPPYNIEKREINFKADKSGEIFCFKVCNSFLADSRYEGQERSMQNDINELLLKHFGGTYQVISETEEGPVILFTYPENLSE